MSHSGRPSTIQRKRLLELVRLNYAQLTGRLTAAGNARRRRKWMEIAGELNNVRDINGSVRVIKSSDQWKRCWTDIRLKTKAKLDKSDLREIEFTSDDEAVIDICGPVADGEQSDEEGRTEWGKGRLLVNVPTANELRNSIYTPSTSSSPPAISINPTQSQPPPYHVAPPTAIHPSFTNYMSTELSNIGPVLQPPPIKLENLQDSTIPPSRSLSPEIFSTKEQNESAELQREMVGNLQTIVDMLGKLISKADIISEINSVQPKSSCPSEKNSNQSHKDYPKKKMTKYDFFHMCQNSLKKSNGEMNEYDLVGQNVAKKLQRMDPNQALFAESIINMALKRGLLNTLTGDTALSEKKASLDRN